jgi:hypothetical protein
VFLAVNSQPGSGRLFFVNWRELIKKMDFTRMDTCLMGDQPNIGGKHKPLSLLIAGGERRFYRGT